MYIHSHIKINHRLRSLDFALKILQIPSVKTYYIISYTKHFVTTERLYKIKLKICSFSNLKGMFIFRTEY